MNRPILRSKIGLFSYNFSGKRSDLKSAERSDLGERKISMDLVLDLIFLNEVIRKWKCPCGATG